MSNSGQVAVVTGGSRGIGPEIVRKLQDADMKVAVLSRSEENPHGDLSVSCDVADHDSVVSAIDTITDQLGSVEVLVNNAGTGRYAPFTDLAAEDWSSMFGVNVLGLVNVTKTILPGMLSRGSGHIVNLGSKQAFEAAPKASAYAASKAAVVSISRCLAAEISDSGVHITVLNPGGVLTDFASIPVEKKSETYLTPEEVAEAAASAIAQPGKSYYREILMLPT